MKEKINVRFLLLCLASLLVLGVSWFGVHAFQMRHHRAVLLDLVQRAEEQGKLDREIRLLGQFVKLVPQDVNARERYGLLIEKLIEKSPRDPGLKRLAASVYEQVLMKDPKRQGVRRRLAILTFQLDEVDEAMELLKAVRDFAPKDAEVADLLAQCNEAKSNYKEAATLYDAAIKADASRVEAYVRYARLLQLRLDKAGEADKWMNEMVKANPRSYRAFLERARYRNQFKLAQSEASARTAEIKLAEADAAEARRLAPEKAEPLLV